MSGANVSDTAGARLGSPLLVEVRDTTGRLAPVATVVRFQVTTEGGNPTAWVTPLDSENPASFASGRTDASGRTGVLVKLGYRATAARIVITVPTLGVQDTARFTVTPGAAARLQLSPRDTAVYVGGNYLLRGSVTDAYGNARTDALTFSTVGTGATVTSAGQVSGSAVGRYVVVASGGGVTDTVQLSVIPEAVIAALRFDKIVSMNLGRGSARDLVQVEDRGIGVHPAWIPGTDRIVYSTYNGTYQELRTVDEQGVSTRVLPLSTPFITHQAEPSPSADGRWLFFTAYDERCAVEDYCLQRLRLDGSSAPEVLGVYANYGRRSRFPGPSPDGAEVAFQNLESDGLLQVLNIATRQVRSLNVKGTYPLWRPTGDLIAFRTPGGGLAAVRPDGTGATTIYAGQGYSTVNEPFSWSPDGLWILYRPFGGAAQMVNVDTGAIIPLPFIGGYVAPRWKP